MSAVGTARRVRRSSGRTSSTWWLKKLLLSALVIGALGSFTVASTFAVLSTETKNVGSTLSSGTLTFGNKVGTASTCFSYNGAATTNGNVNANCTALFTSATEAYPGSPLETPVQIVNNGSLNVSKLELYTATGGCTNGNSTVAGAPTGNTGNPCGAGGLMFYVQETDAAGTATKCWYPTGVATAACPYNADTLSSFTSTFTDTGLWLSLGAGPARGVTRYFKIGVQLPIAASATLQGRSASFGLTWHITN